MIDDLEDISDKKVDLDLFFEIKRKEDNEETPKKYVRHKNPYDIPTPDYMFMIKRIEGISEKKAS